jgi:monosaccharide-transporting ATPase
VYEISDRITVLRNGELVGEYEVKDLPRVQLISKMMGKDLEDVSTLQKRKISDEKSDVLPIYEAVGLSSTNCPMHLILKYQREK